MKIAISSDTAIDLQEDLLKKYDISTVPYTITYGGKEYIDGQLDIAEMYKYCDEHKQLPKTSAINVETFNEYFSKLLQSYDAIIHIALSSEITSACQHARMAAQNFKNVYVIDSRSLSTGIALLAIYARELSYTIDDPAEICKKVEQRVSKVQASFILDTLDYLKKGGRCSALTAFGAKVLSLHPQILLKDGKMVVGKKYMGRRMEKLAVKYALDTLAEFNHPDKHVIFVTHSVSDPGIAEAVLEEVKKYGFENVYETTANATVSSHCGKNTIGILYINDGEEELELK